MITGDDLRQLRVHAGLSATMMAKKLGVSRNTIQNYENGSSEPKVSDYLKWILICRVNTLPYLSKVLARKNPGDLINIKALDKDADEHS